MQHTHQTYIDTFMEVGYPLLHEKGYTAEVVHHKVKTLTKIILHKVYPNPYTLPFKYMLIFSTDVSGITQGVLIGDLKKDTLDRSKIRLPNAYRRKKKDIYAFSGDNLAREIKRLLNDFIYFNTQRLSPNFIPFDYCTQGAGEKELSCKFKHLTKLGENEKYSIFSTYYKCNNCQGYWKKSSNGEREIWLKIGESTDRKYSQENKTNHFSSTYFNLNEAIEHGLEVPCGKLENINNYNGLSCFPTNLKLKKEISFDGAIGCHTKIDIFKCKKCKQQYKIIEIYDSMKGTYFTCLKPKETKKVAGVSYTFN